MQDILWPRAIKQLANDDICEIVGTYAINGERKEIYIRDRVSTYNGNRYAITVIDFSFSRAYYPHGATHGSPTPINILVILEILS